MELIDIHMRLTPSQMFELSALVQKWQDHERGVVIKKEFPTRVLENYQKPEPKKPDTWPARLKMIVAGMEAIRLDAGMTVSDFCTNRLKLRDASYYSLKNGKRVIQPHTAKKLANRMGMSLDELEKKGVATVYGTPTKTNVSGKGVGTGLPSVPLAGS
ncbi:helix-turn-helix domain-containing protein [Acidaminococcus fermentans]|uniref:helix-turn-helix domain-containing protein n=1 Tax=Acidaminococcus fermentans TaxID=905 RepID=UPI003D0699E9